MQSDWFIALQKQIQMLGKLQQLFFEVLPADLAPHVQVLTFDKGILSVGSATASFTSRLHFLTPELIKQLRHFPELAGLQQIRYQVIQPTSESKRRLQPVSPISHESAEVIAKVARAIKEPELQSALLKLARAS